MPHLVVIGRVIFVIRVRVPHSCRRLYVQHIGNLVPAEGVLLQGGTISLHLMDIQQRTSRFHFQSVHLYKNLHGTVRSLTKSRLKSCNRGRHSTTGPEGQWQASAGTSQTCRRWGPWLDAEQPRGDVHKTDKEKPKIIIYIIYEAQCF